MEQRAALNKISRKKEQTKYMSCGVGRVIFLLWCSQRAWLCFG